MAGRHASVPTVCFCERLVGDGATASSLTRLGLARHCFCAHIVQDPKTCVPVEMGRPNKMRFDAQIVISSLIHVPFITGVYYVKWTVSSGVFSKKNQGATLRIPVKDHRVDWHQPISLMLELSFDKLEDQLKPVYLNLRVKQEFAGGQKSEVVGEVLVNLAELIDTNEANRKYLLQKSKINSSLKLIFTLKRAEDESEPFEPTPGATSRPLLVRSSDPPQSPQASLSVAFARGSCSRRSNLSIETTDASLRIKPASVPFAIEDGIPPIGPLLEDSASACESASLSETDSFYCYEDFMIAGKKSYLKNKKWIRELFQYLQIKND